MLYTTVYRRLSEAFNSLNYRVFVLEGGSRSSKTHSIIQFWIRWAKAKGVRPGLRVAVCRLKGTWLSATVMKDFIDQLKLFGIYSERNHNKTNKIYTLYGVEFWFIGLDDQQKIHGLKTAAFWINEAIEATKDDFDQLMQRCDGFAILDYNPTEYEHWIYDSVKKRSDCFYCHSTFKDNEMISDNARLQILSYEPTDLNYLNGTADARKWQVYGLGLPAKIEGLVFPDFTIVKNMPDFRCKEFQGLDFGFTNDVTAHEDVFIHIGQNHLYLDELCYKTHMESKHIISHLKIHNHQRKIWADSADPRLITEIHNAGFNIHAVDKFHVKGSINAGIDRMKTMRIFITENSFNIIKEFKNYTYQQDKNNKWLNVPVDNFNHAIDGTRYVILSELLGRVRKARNFSKMGLQ